MTAWEAVFVLLAGIGGGLTGSVAGLASLMTYPALLVVGLTPLTANVTNTVSLVFSSAGSVLGSRPELRGQRPRVLRLRHQLVQAVPVEATWLGPGWNRLQRELETIGHVADEVHVVDAKAGCRRDDGRRSRRTPDDRSVS